MTKKTTAVRKKLKKAEKKIKEVQFDLKTYLEKVKPQELTDGLINIYLAWAGFQHFKTIDSLFFAPISLKLAMSENAVAGAVGVAGLVTLGIVLPISSAFVEHANTKVPINISGVDPEKAKTIGTPTVWEMHQMMTGTSQTAEDLRAKYWEN